MLANCTTEEYENPALPMPTSEPPAYLDDLAPCKVCHNSGEPCGYCGGGGYGDDQPLPTIASLTPSCPECEAGPHVVCCPCCANSFEHAENCPECGTIYDGVAE